MRGARVGGPPASSNRGARQRRRARSGSADRGGHGRPIGASTIRIESSVRGGAAMRRAYVLLIAIAIAIVVFHELTSMFAGGHVHGGSGRGVSAVVEMHAVDLVWALPAIATGAAVGAALTVASASRAGITALARFGVPSIGPAARARANGLTWAAIAVLGVHFTGEAFDVLPGGHSVAAILLGVVLGVGTFRLHRNSIEHEAYRTFNLIAMLLAVGSLASMSITPTGAWWTHNFSTLGTSDDIAAACFNIAIVFSGAGMAAMSAALTRAVADPRYGTRRFGLVAMRVLIALIGLSLMGVGLVPIDGATDLHNAAASSAAAAFAVLCLGVQLWARRLPRSLRDRLLCVHRDRGDRDVRLRRHRRLQPHGLRGRRVHARLRVAHRPRDHHPCEPSGSGCRGPPSPRVRRHAPPPQPRRGRRCGAPVDAGRRSP